jgi:molecular chaperone GrpE (heat shock protein)
LGIVGIANVFLKSSLHLAYPAFSCINELEAKLQFERERREALEAEMDQMRKQLQRTQCQLQKYQAVSSPHHKVPLHM